MAIPKSVKFDRYAQASGRLLAVALNSPFVEKPNGIALVTGWLSGDPWNTCLDSVTTTWSACYSAPSTTWTGVTVPTTVWTPWTEY